MSLRQSNPRRALTLLEVVVSMPIFLISIIAIWQLVTVGSDRQYAAVMQLGGQTKPHKIVASHANFLRRRNRRDVINAARQSRSQNGARNSFRFRSRTEEVFASLRQCGNC